MILHAARSQPSKLHTITYNILSSIPVSCSLNNKCMNESKLCMCLAVLQRCTTPPSIALNLFLSSCLHCVVCTSWGHGAECIKMSALWHLSFAHSLKWNIPGDVTDGSRGLTLLKLSDAGILSRAAVTVQWDGEETSDHRVHSGSAGPIIIVTTHR